MSMQSTKLPVWFWVIAVAGLLWTLMGVASYVMDVTMSEEALAAMPQAQRDIYATRPSWVVGLYAVAVFGALIGAIALVMRKSFAVPFFGVSLAAVVVQMAYVLFGMSVIATLGVTAAIFPAVIVVIGALLLWFSMQSKSKGWLK
jgi:hypothetical protein